VTHLPFVAAAYAMGILLPLAFAVDAFRRTGAARRKLAAIDPRQNRGGV
jgi:cytochrome c biogenesis protein CcdA